MERLSLALSALAIGVMAALSLAAGGAPMAPGPENHEFSAPLPVTIDGYIGHAMEPFLARDGTLLFFNNRNAPSDQTDLHLARRTGPTRFRYLGRLAGANSAALDGVASADRYGRFYFVSTREYRRSGNTLWTGSLMKHAVVDAAPLLTDFTPKRALRLNIDMEISADGGTLYFAENRWDLLRGVPASSDLAMASRSGSRFVRMKQSDQWLAAINTPALEFAPATSADQLTLYFTRLDMNLLRRKLPGAFAIMVATRANLESAWSEPQRIAAITGQVEGPTVTPDGCGIYFHRLEDGMFRLFLAQRKDCLKRSAVTQDSARSLPPS